MITFGPDINAFMGGFGVGLSIFFVVLLLSLGASAIRRMVDG